MIRGYPRVDFVMFAKKLKPEKYEANVELEYYNNYEPE